MISADREKPEMDVGQSDCDYGRINTKQFWLLTIDLQHVYKGYFSIKKISGKHPNLTSRTLYSRLVRKADD